MQFPNNKPKRQRHKNRKMLLSTNRLQRLQKSYEKRTQNRGKKMIITKEQLQELNKTGKTEIFRSNAHTPYWDIIEVKK